MGSYFRIIFAFMVLSGCAETEAVLEKKDTSERITWIRVWYRPPSQQGRSLYPHAVKWSISIDCRPKAIGQKIEPMTGISEGGQWFFRWPRICPDSGIEISDIEILPNIDNCDPENQFFPEKKIGEFVDITLKCEDGNGKRR